MKKIAVIALFIVVLIVGGFFLYSGYSHLADTKKIEASLEKEVQSLSNSQQIETALKGVLDEPSIEKELEAVDTSTFCAIVLIDVGVDLVIIAVLVLFFVVRRMYRGIA